MAQAQLRSIVAGVQTTPPTDWPALTLELSYMSGQPKLTTSDFEFTDDAKDILTKHIADGLTGGVGIFEAPSLELDLICDGVVTPMVKALIDLTTAKLSPIRVQSATIERDSIDFLNEVADSFRYEYLTTLPAGTPGRITSADYLPINYVIGKYPQYVEILLAAVSVYVLLKETYEIAKRIADITTQTIALIATGGFTSAIAGPLFSAAEILLLLGYLALVIIALIDLVEKLFTLLFPFVYYHKAIRLSTLFQRGCEFLGYTFSSTIMTGLANDLVYMPTKDVPGAFVGKANNETALYPGTFGDYLREMEEYFNAKTKLINGVVYFENENYYNNPSGFIIPDVCNEFYTTNASEAVSNYFLSYRNDNTDLWSYNNISGINYQVTMRPKVINDKKAVLLKGLSRTDFNYSLSYVKTTTSDLEAIMIDVYNFLAGIINAIANIGGGSNPLPTIPKSASKYCLILDTHFTGSPRMLLLKDTSGKVRDDFAANFGAEQMWKKYHYTKSFVPQAGNTKGNQWIRYDLDKIDMCCEDFLLLLNNNYATYRGQSARIRSLKYSPFQNSASISFEINQTYTTNLVETYVKDGGR